MVSNGYLKRSEIKDALDRFSEGATSEDIQFYLAEKNGVHRKPRILQLFDSEKISRHLRHLYKDQQALRFRPDWGKTRYIGIPD